MKGNGRSGSNKGTTPLKRYVSIKDGRLEKGATRTTPAKIVGPRCEKLSISESPSKRDCVSVFLYFIGAGSKEFIGLTKLKATALATAVPRL
jgi:hypothetical protein